MIAHHSTFWVNNKFFLEFSQQMADSEDSTDSDLNHSGGEEVSNHSDSDYKEGKVSDRGSTNLSNSEEERIKNLTEDIDASDSRLNVGHIFPVTSLSQNLVNLTLNNIILDVPESAEFPNLKNLALIGVQWVNEMSLKNLLWHSRCRVLSNLFMHRQRDDIMTYQIGLKTMTSLCINTHSRPGCRIVLAEENLEEFDLTCHLDDELDVGYISTLKSVVLDILQDISSTWNDRKLYDLLIKVSNAEYMNLSHSSMLTLASPSYKKLPVFHCLTHLKVELSNKCCNLLHFLDFTPSLVSLVATKDNDDKSINDGAEFIAPTSVPGCFLWCLERMELHTINLEMIRYILLNATVLKDMTICMKDFEMRLRENEIVSYPRVSSECNVVLRCL